MREHHDKNFANYFPIWDHLFGTYYEGDADVQSSVWTATTSTKPIRSAKASPQKSVSSNARGKLPRPSAA
ncbi:hypothetical protein RLEG3_03835 (plasmid) [Rhizobium leguminosarum bv. trifolii WSM1689]|nr:hypothetical protein RLEG3_03835 [Rhizobium leguminosarum bv. trifolii WSM1689]